MPLPRKKKVDGPSDHPPFSISDLTPFFTPYTLSLLCVNESGCWVWTGTINEKGYGTIKYKGKTHRVHRLVYELLVEPIPTHLHADHTCHDGRTCTNPKTCPHRACVNPAHIQPATNQHNTDKSSRNIARREDTHCLHGHEWNEENTRIRPYDGARVCRTCVRLSRQGKLK